MSTAAMHTGSSASIRARSPHPAESPTPRADSEERSKSIELIEIGQNTSHHKQSAVAAVSKRPASLIPRDVARRKARIQFATLCWSLFVLGWNDGTTGPLLPRIQKVYNVGFTVVSMIFVFNCLGFIIGAAANVALTDHFGFGTVMVIGAVAQMIGYSLESPAPPFPVFVLGYAINGFGMSLQDAGANGYISCLTEGGETKMGLMHAVYGLGALCSPLVATQFAQRTHWSFHYLISLSVAFINTILLAGVLRFRTQDECLASIGQIPDDAEADNVPGSVVQDRGRNASKDKYKQMFRLRALHLLALFIFIYVGVEVTIGGWIVTYVQEVRAGGPSSGYISSGFFGGLTVGRVALLWINKTVGERRVIFVYALLAIALELVVWLVPSLIGGAVAVSLVGLLLGPIYPIAMNHSGRVLPPWLITGCIGWIAGIGQAGSAFLPFLTGLLASKEGIASLQPLLVSMMGCMLVLWAIVPSHTPRTD